MTKNEKLEQIKKIGIIAIMRAKSSDQLIKAAEGIRSGGINVIEVTMTTPGALDVVKQAKIKFGEDVLFGVGSVTDPETAESAIQAGADFIVGPTLNLEVISLCNQTDIPVIPGCYSPTEVLTAWNAGADLIKLFPASVGGPSLIKAILAPLPQVEIVPVGGVNLDTAADFIRNGAVALGIGSALINQSLLEANDMDELTRRTSAFINAVNEGRRN